MSIIRRRDADEILTGIVVSAVTQVQGVIDCSLSVAPFIDDINRGLRQIGDELKADEIAADCVEFTVTSFASDVRVEAGPVMARDFEPPTLSTRGTSTAGGEAVHKSIDLTVAGQKRYAYEGTRVKVPWVLGLTDGCFTDEWRSAAMRVRALAARGKLNFFMAYLGNADVAQLSELCPPDQPPLPLDQTKFSDYFKWVSRR